MNVTESCFPNNAKFDKNCAILSKTCSINTKSNVKYLLRKIIGNKIIDKLKCIIVKNNSGLL